MNEIPATGRYTQKIRLKILEEISKASLDEERDILERHDLTIEEISSWARCWVGRMK